MARRETASTLAGQPPRRSALPVACSVPRGLPIKTLASVNGGPKVSSHVFRKTVATRLDEAKLSARQIADHLGHNRPSLTQDVYRGRGFASPEAATALQRSP